VELGSLNVSTCGKQARDIVRSDALELSVKDRDEEVAVAT